MGLFGGGDAQLTLGVAMDVAAAHKGAQELTKDIDGVDKKADSVGKSGGGLNGILDKLGPLALGAGAGVLALGGFLAGAAKAAADEQVGIERLNGALKNNIPNWDGNTQAIDAYVTKQQQLAFSDDEIRDSLGQLVTQTHDLKEAQDLQATAMDLARAKGIDLSTASKLVGKVDMDNIGTLKKLGIAVDEHATKEEALAAIRQATAGQAEAYANTAAGAMDRVQNALGDAMETIGGAVLNIVSGPLQAFADWITSPEVTAGIQSLADFIGGALVNAFNLIGQVISTVWPILQPFVDAWVTFFQQIGSGGDVLASVGTLFQNFGQAISDAWAVVGPALGTLLQNILGWIGENGPTILGQLATWAVGFGSWVINDAIPALLSALGTLISQLWTWIQENGPGILAQLGTWAQQFGAWIWNDALPALFSALGTLLQNLFQWIGDNGPGILSTLGQWAQSFAAWVINDALPWLFNNLGTLIGNLLQWIGDNGPTILAKLGEWAGAFFQWVVNSAIPWVLQHLGDLLGNIIQWIGDNGPTILSKLGEWATQFFNWVTQDVLPQLPGWLGQIASALWTWVTTTASDLLTKLVNEWLPAFWNWITGPDGILVNIGVKLGEVATAIWTWITTTAGDAFNKVLSIGSNIVDGIKKGISDGWDAFVNWVKGLLGDMVDAVKAFFGISSPSTVFADMGMNMVAGMQQGWDGAFGGLQKNMMKDVSSLVGGIGGTVGINPTGDFSGGLAAMPTGGGRHMNIGEVNIHATPGTDGARVAADFIDALQEQIGVTVRLRNPSLVGQM